MLVEHIYVFFTGVLGTFVRIVDIRCPVFGDYALQEFDAPLLVHRIGYSPIEYLPAMHVHYGVHVREAQQHGDIGDVGLPYLIGALYFQVLEQIGVLVAVHVPYGGPWPSV